VHPRALRDVDREQLRPRVLAFAGLWFLIAGLLAAIGFVIPLVVSVALLLGVGIVEGARRLLRRYPVEHRLRAVGSSSERAVRELGARVDDLHLQEHLQRFAGNASQRARTVLEVRPRERVEIDPLSRARRLNELGAQLRRDGDPEQAAEEHLAALAITRELGDRRAEALTLNNLALALVHTGTVSVAVEHFEQALAIFRERGDEELEGQVIANLGSVRRRQGRDEDAVSLLHEALDKLPPESHAYRQVEEQLRRAS
jgi:tetratricopeptide (TPR) repeat protein